MRLALALIAGLPGPVAAETPMTGAEFEAYVGTDTVTYAYESGLTGIADYGPDRTLRWQFADDGCVDARWHEDGDALCFVFELPEMSACWHFYRRGKGIVGIGIGDAANETITDTARSAAPLACAAASLEA
jgi:hypothetical protein